MDRDAVYREFPPENRLERIVECFWSLSADRDHWQWVLPDGCVDLLLRFYGNRCWVEVVETMTEAKYVKIPRGYTYLGIRFRPGMAIGALAIGTDLSSDRILPVRELKQPRNRKVMRELAWTPSIETRVKIVSSLISSCEQVPSAQKALNAMVENDGNLQSQELCDLARLSERQLRRYFVQRTGVSPKMLARILRFKKVCRILQTEPQAKLSNVAIDAGYYDQAHFNREFKALAQQTPGDFRKIPIKWPIYPIRTSGDPA